MTSEAIMRDRDVSDEQYRQLLEHAIGRGRSLETPRALPSKRERKALPKARLPESGRSGADEAADRMERRAAAHASEEERNAEARSAPRRSTRDVDVDSPYGTTTNKTDRVALVIDTIDWMLRRGDIDASQGSAARKVQDAWAAAPGALRCTLAPGAGGAGPGPRSPSEQQIWAGGILNDVRTALGEIDGLIVLRVCAIGLSIYDTARVVFGIADGEKVKPDKANHVGMRLRMGLVVLAKLWGLQVSRGKVHATRGAKAGHANVANFGELSSEERERIAPLQHASRQRDAKLLRKARRKMTKGKGEQTA